MGFSDATYDKLIDGIARNEPPVFPVLAASLHKADPDDEDGSNATASLVDTAVERAQITSSASAGGANSSTGDPATWVIEEAATLTHLGLHDAFTAGDWVGSEPLDQTVTVAEGDVVSLLSFTIKRGD